MTTQTQKKQSVSSKPAASTKNARAAKTSVKSVKEVQKPIDWGNIMKGVITIFVIALLVLGTVWLGKKIFEPKETVSTEASNTQVNANAPVVQAQCMYQAGQLGLPTNIANIVCNGKEGQVSEQLPSGTKVPFGTITFDCENRVWILKDFTVPSVANYSFSYQNAEKNLLNAPFLVGSELGWSKDCKENNVPFTVCYNFEGECSLSEEIVSQLFPSK